MASIQEQGPVEGVTIERYWEIDRVVVKTDHPVALDSPDHIAPFGTAQDNSRNHLFNEKLYALYPSRSPLILDLGCAGGGFVHDCINDGCLAVGIEGSDFSLRMNRAEWPIGAGKFLFTADITKPFEVEAIIRGEAIPLSFDVITAWEVMEHIAEPNLPAFMENINRHLSANGLLFFSISAEESSHHGIHLHQTMQSREWWLGYFRGHGLDECTSLEAYFKGRYIRGRGTRFELVNRGRDFVLILSRKSATLPVAAPVSTARFFYDLWRGSWLQRVLQKLLVG